MIVIVLMVSSIIDKKSPRPGGRAEHRATDLRERTRRIHASLIPEQLSLSSRYFLKRSKIDISHDMKFLSGGQRSSCSPSSQYRKILAAVATTPSQESLQPPLR